VKKMLCRIVVACTVWTRRRLLSSDMVEIAGHKRAVACPQLGDGDALASGPAESLVELHTGVSHKSAVGGRVRITWVACMELLVSHFADRGN